MLIETSKITNENLKEIKNIISIKIVEKGLKPH